MKKIAITLLIVMISILLSFSVEALDVSARSAVLIEAESKDVIYEKNCHQKLPMASTTKIMTSLLTLESGALNQKVVPTKEMLMVEGTSMGLLPGDTVTVKGLVYGMLLSSGNDAANVAALKVGGSLENFSRLMNKRAKQIGMMDTNFVTPSGLDAPGHHSTAYDMALLGAEAINNVEFRSICSARSARISYGNPPYQRTLSNHNSLLKKYPYAIGIKTGYTKKSKRCLVSAAEKDGVTLVAVTLNAPNDWDDHEKMFEYGFSQYKSVLLDNDVSDLSIKVIGSVTKSVPVQCNDEPQITIKGDDNPEIVKRVELRKFEYAPISQCEVVGTIKYFIGDKLMCESPIVTAESAESNTIVKEVKPKRHIIRDFFEKFKK